jgi:hypothetical protein
MMLMMILATMTRDTRVHQMVNLPNTTATSSSRSRNYWATIGSVAEYIYVIIPLTPSLPSDTHLTF